MTRQKCGVGPSRRFDGYICAPEPLKLGRVISIGQDRLVVEWHFPNFESWNKERQGVRKWDLESIVGRFDEETAAFSSVPEPPREGYFYGANYLPGEIVARLSLIQRPRQKKQLPEHAKPEGTDSPKS